MVVFVLHEDHVSQLQTMDEVLNAWAEITSTGPDVLNEGDLTRIDLEFLSQPSIVELHALVLEEDELSRLVEYLDADHHEAREVSTRESDIIEIVEPEAKLRANEWIGWGIHLSSHAVRLEAENTSRHVIHIISPAGNDRVSIDLGARNPRSRKRAFKGIPSLLVCDLFFESDAASLADEGVLAATAE